MYDRLLVQDGRVKECVLISSCKSTRIAASCWTAINRRMLKPIKKIPHVQRQRRSRRIWQEECSHNQIKSHTHHELENNNIKDVLPLLWRFWTPCQVSQLEEPQGIWPWSPGGLDYRISTGLGETETLVLESTNKALLEPRPKGKEQWPCRRLNRNYLLPLKGLLWRHGSPGAPHRDGGTGSSRPGRSPSA